jgi:HK97 family phage major capsid protein
MKTITQYRDEINALKKKIADIDAKAISENRDLSVEELDLKNEMFDQIKYLNYTISTLESQEQIINSIEAPQAPKTIEKKQAQSTNKPYIQVNDRRQDRFNSFGEQLAAVMKAGVPGGKIDPRLFNATGLSESVGSDGGFLVQQDYASGLLQDIFETGILASRCQEVIISGPSNSIKINGIDETSRASTRYGGIVGYWQEEAGTKTASKPKFRQIELNLNKLIGLCYATDELMEDAAALEGVIRQGFVSEFGFLVDDAIINGSGAGKPLGIMNSGCLVSVGKETGQTAATIVAENVIKMYSRMFASSLSNAVWLVNQNCLPQLFTMSLSVGTGGSPIFMPAGGLSQTPYNTILGRPVIPIEQCQTLGTTGDILFCDLKGYLLAKKGNIQSDMSIHVRFVYDESVFRFVLRTTGQPIRSSALTPFKGGSSYTQSHFIALDTRS